MFQAICLSDSVSYLSIYLSIAYKFPDRVIYFFVGTRTFHQIYLSIYLILFLSFFLIAYTFPD